MAASAHLTSVEALSRLKYAVQCFEEGAADGLAAVQMEIQRIVGWIEHDQPQYWQGQVRRGWDDVAEARSNLERCQMMEVAGHRPACREEQEALNKAKRKLRRAEEQVDAVRHWSRVVNHEVTEYEARAGQLTGWLEADCPKAVATLERMATALEAYTHTTAPSANPLEEAAASMARPVDDAPDATASVDSQRQPPDTAARPPEAAPSPQSPSPQPLVPNP